MSTYVKFGYKQKREHKNPKLCSMYPIPDGDKFESVKRSFELAQEGCSINAIVKQLKIEFPNLTQHFSRSRVDTRLRDSFYCGLWNICQGKKNERSIDLNQIVLMDGTRFTPMLSLEDFHTIQALRSKNVHGPARKRKRLNPLPQLVSCHHCG